MDLNKVMLAGNLTRDPELRFTSSGVPVATLNMAINRYYKKTTGDKTETKHEVTYVRVNVWRKQAEAAGEFLKKGNPVFVEGRLTTRSWETDGGEKRSVMEVTADRVQFLSQRQKAEADSAAEASAEEEAPVADEVPAS